MLHLPFPCCAAAFLVACSGTNAIPPGHEGGPCYGNNTCNAGLSCYSALCVRAADASAADSNGRDTHQDTPRRDRAALGNCDPVPLARLADLPVAVNTQAIAPLFPANVLLVGGRDQFLEGAANPKYYRNVWMYDVAANKFEDWGEILPYAMGFFRNDAAALGNNGRVYVTPALGPNQNNGWGSHKCLVEIDLQQKSAVEKHCFPSNRWNVRLVADPKGVIYGFGGWNGASVAEIWRLDAIAGTFDKVADSAAVAWNDVQESVLGPGGRIYHFDPSNIGVFDPTTSSTAILAKNTLPAVHLIWSTSDSLRGFASTKTWTTGMAPYDLVFNVDIATAAITTQKLTTAVIDRYHSARVVDDARRHAYFFGGVDQSGTTLSAVDRTDCLP